MWSIKSLADSQQSGLKFGFPQLSLWKKGVLWWEFILDGVVIASEAIYSMCSYREYTMFNKLDMAKAYDRVNQGFLQKVLLASQEWVKWVLSCITTPSFLVLLNGKMSIFFGASRGLGQGDPLSPYLFIIMAKGLGRLIKSHVSQNMIQRWRWGNYLPTLSHLKFIDDMTLVGRSQIQ